MKKTTDIDPNAKWEQLIQSQASPTRELFDKLFAEGNEEKIILAVVPLIRKYNRGTRKAIKEDVECYAITEVATEIKKLLARPNANPGSYLIDVVRHAIHKAKFGTHIEARDCVSTNQRIYRPRKRESDAERNAFIRKLESQGRSAAMIEAELSSRGWDQSKLVDVESEWPMVTDVDGERWLAEFGETEPTTNDDWQTLSELCTEQEMQLLECLAQGHTHAEAAEVFDVSISTIKKRLAAIRAKVQRSEDV